MAVIWTGQDNFRVVSVPTLTLAFVTMSYEKEHKIIHTSTSLSSLALLGSFPEALTSILCVEHILTFRAPLGRESRVRRTPTLRVAL